MKKITRTVFMVLGVGLATGKYGLNPWAIFLGISAGYFTADVTNWLSEEFEKLITYLDIYEDQGLTNNPKCDTIISVRGDRNDE